jgi:hypothetical protein
VARQLPKARRQFYRVRSVELREFLMAVVVLFSVVEASGAQFTLSWVDNSAGLAAFSIERRPGGGLPFAPLAALAPGVTSYIDAAVADGSTYCYRVLAYTAVAVSPYSNEACGATPFVVTVSKAGKGNGTVTSSPAGISCGTDCFEAYPGSYPVGTAVTLVATADPGSTFVGWSGGGCSGTLPCTLVGNVSVAVIATFCRSRSNQCQGI